MVKIVFGWMPVLASLRISSTWSALFSVLVLVVRDIVN